MTDEEKILVEEYVYDRMIGFVNDIYTILNESRKMLNAFDLAIKESSKALDIIEQDIQQREKLIKKDFNK